MIYVYDLFKTVKLIDKLRELKEGTVESGSDNIVIYIYREIYGFI